MSRPARYVMPSAILAVTVVFALAAADQRPKAVKVDVKRPTSAAEKLNQSLKAMYESLSSTSPRPEELKSLTDELNANLSQLAKLDPHIKGLGEDVNDAGLKEDALRYRALAWLHGWACFAQLAEVSARADTVEGRNAAALIGIESGKESTLTHLLKTHKQMVDTEKEPNALRQRLKHDTGFVIDLGFRKPWGEAKKPDARPASFPKTHGDFIPSAADIVGEPNAAPRLDPRGLLSLWALVNLQLDTWRGDKPPVPGGMDLKPVSEWLANLAKYDGIEAFDDDARKRGTEFRERVKKLSDFMSVRHELQAGATLDKVITELQLDHARAIKCENQLFNQLASAAQPIKVEDSLPSESLPPAEIWLRYVFLLSYRGEGPLVIVGDAKNSPKHYWRLCKLPGEFDDPRKPDASDDPRKKQPETAALVRWEKQPESVAFVRWNQKPAAGHFDRAVYDATRGAFGYLEWEAGLPKLEVARFGALVKRDNSEGFQAQLKAHLARIDSIDGDHLAGYFPLRSAYGVSTQAVNGKLVPFRFSIPILADRGTTPTDWWGQCSPEERVQLSGDLRQIAAQARGMARLQHSIFDAYSVPKVEESAVALQGLSTHMGGTEWDVTAMPLKPFMTYRQEVKEALDDLDKELDGAQFRRDLVDRYNLRRDEADIRELEYASAKLGVKIAEKGKRLGDALERVATLNTDIAVLAKEAAALRLAAAQGGVGAAEKRLQLVNRARDLAAAQVDALLDAQAKAGELVQQAVQELEALRPKLMEIAQQIEDSKKTSFLSVLKAIVKVVSVALGPFTGGASIGIGAAVDQALTIAENLGKIDWNNPLQAVGQIGNLVEDVGKLGDLSIGTWGGADLKKSWSDVKGWVKKREGEVKQFGDDAKKLVDHLKQLPRVEFSKLVGPLAAAANLDLPVEIDSAKNMIKIDFGKAGIKVNDAQLRDAWSRILENGATLTTDTKGRVEKWGKLIGLDDANLKQELPKAIDELIGVLPPELVKDVKSAKESAEDGKQKLKAFADQTDAAGRRFLAQTLAGQLVVVVDASGEVKAVERGLAKEVAHTKARIEAFKAKVLRGKIKELVATIAEQNAKLNTAVGAAQDAKDEEQLRKIANGPGGVTVTIAEIQGKLAEFEGEITVARGELQDAETRVDIEAALKESAVQRAEAAKKDMDIKALEDERAKIEKEAARIQHEMLEMTLAQKEIEMRAADLRVQSARAALQRTYSDCLRWGFNPLAAKVDWDTQPLPGLAGVLRVRKDAVKAETAQPSRLRAAAVGLVGMLQWVRLVGQGGLNDKSVNSVITEHYTTIVNLMADNKPAAEVRKELKAVSDELHMLIQKVDLPSPYFVPDYGNKNGRIVEWLTTPLKGGDRDIALSDVPSRFRPRVVGRIRILAASVEPHENGKYAGFKRTANATRGYYGFPRFADVTCPTKLTKVLRGDYEFIIVPPSDGRPSIGITGWVTPDAPLTPPKPVADRIEAIIALGKLEKSLPELWNSKVELRPAIGEWRIYIIAVDMKNPPNDPEAWRVAQAKAWEAEKPQFYVYLPFAEFPLPK